MNLDGELVLLRAGGPGRRAAIGRLYDRYGGDFKRYFRRHGASREAAEDLLQDTFVSVLRHLDSFQGSGSFEAWLWTIARNTLTSSFRRQRGELSLDALDADVADSVVSARGDSAPSDPALADCLGRAFARYSARYRDYAEALTRVVVDGWGYEELAQFRASSNGAAREFLSQSRKRLMEFVQPCLDPARLG